MGVVAIVLVLTVACGAGATARLARPSPSGEMLAVETRAPAPIPTARGTFYIVDTVGCDGSTDGLSAIQAVLDAASPHSTIVFPAGDCYVHGTLNITKALVLTGQGPGASQITQGSAAATTFSITTTQAVEMRGLFIRHATAASAGACIHVDPASGVNFGSRFTDLILAECFDGFRTTRAAHWSLTRAFVLQPTSTGVWVQNDDNHDEGDSQISDSLFNLSADTEGIAWVSSGGLRVINNKFLSGRVPISIVPGSDVRTTGILLVTGNSLDWYEVAGVEVHTSGTSSFVMTTITGNEFGGFVGGTAAVSISGSNGLNYASTITGNSFNLTCLRRCERRGQYGVLLAHGAQAIVTGNVFGGASPRGTAIHIAPTFNEAAIGENSYSPALGASISNGSVTTRLKTNVPLKWAVIQESLGAPLAGSEVWCTDCRGAGDAGYQAGSICAASGSGAMARRVGSAWRCW
jgi:hypothetical protein